MVVNVYGGLEWGFHDAKRVAGNSAIDERCVGLLGVWGALGAPVVPVEVGGPSGGVADCSKGAPPNPIFNGDMGEVLGWQES